jgi:hypothetical protein
MSVTLLVHRSSLLIPVPEIMLVVSVGIQPAALRTVLGISVVKEMVVAGAVATEMPTPVVHLRADRTVSAETTVAQVMWVLQVISLVQRLLMAAQLH